MNYLDKSEVVTQEDLNAILSSVFPDATVDDEYDHFTQPDIEAFKALDAKYWDAFSISYGSNASDFPLCYDFSELWAAKMREAAIKEGFKARIACGTIRYTMNSGNRHSIGFVVLNNCHVLFREPQPIANPWMDKPEDFKSMENMDI